MDLVDESNSPPKLDVSQPPQASALDLFSEPEEVASGQDPLNILDESPQQELFACECSTTSLAISPTRVLEGPESKKQFMTEVPDSDAHSEDGDDASNEVLLIIDPKVNGDVTRGPTSLDISSVVVESVPDSKTRDKSTDSSTTSTLSEDNLRAPSTILEQTGGVTIAESPSCDATNLSASDIMASIESGDVLQATGQEQAKKQTNSLARKPASVEEGLSTMVPGPEALSQNISENDLITDIRKPSPPNEETRPIATSHEDLKSNKDKHSESQNKRAGSFTGTILTEFVQSVPKSVSENTTMEDSIISHSEVPLDGPLSTEIIPNNTVLPILKDNSASEAPVQEVNKDTPSRMDAAASPKVEQQGRKGGAAIVQIRPSSVNGGSPRPDALQQELKDMKVASLRTRNSHLEREIAAKKQQLEYVTKKLDSPADETVRKHIKLLHDYNDIRDVGQGLMGMIADNRGIRIAELYEEFGVGLKD